MNERWAGSTPWRPRSKTDGPNARYGHWGDRHKRHRPAGEAMLIALLRGDFPVDGLPDNGHGYRVTFVFRSARGKLPDSDNLAGMYKDCRDAVAKFLGVEDGPSGPEWRYLAERSATDETIVLLDRRNGA